MPSDNNLHKAAHKGDLNEVKIYIEAEVGSDDYIDINEPGNTIINFIYFLIYLPTHL